MATPPAPQPEWNSRRAGTRTNLGAAHEALGDPIPDPSRCDRSILNANGFQESEIALLRGLVLVGNQ